MPKLSGVFFLLGASVSGLLTPHGAGTCRASPRGAPTCAAVAVEAVATVTDVETRAPLGFVEDLVLREHAGYSLHKRIELGHLFGSAHEKDSAILAEGSAENWAALRRLFETSEDLYSPMMSSPTTPHHLLGIFPRGDAEYGPDVQRLRRLSIARDNLRGEADDIPIIACVFFSADHMGTHTCDEVLSSSEEAKRVIDEEGLIAFHFSQNILQPMLRQTEIDLAAEKAGRATAEDRATNNERRAVAAEADLAEEQAARAAAEDRIRAAVERLQLKDDADAADILAVLKGDSSGAQD